MKGKKHSKEAKIKISLSLKGKPHSLEHSRKVGLALRGYKHSEQTRKRMSEAHRNTKYTVSLETRLKMANNRKGKELPLETRKKISVSRLGEKNPNWKGGITPIMEKIRDSFEYKIWRKAVFERDNWTCVLCNERGGRLEADHIKSFADFPELRFVISNGRTLCKKCHIQTDSYGWKPINRKKYEQKFLSKLLDT